MVEMSELSEKYEKLSEDYEKLLKDLEQCIINLSKDKDSIDERISPSVTKFRELVLEKTGSEKIADELTTVYKTQIRSYELNGIEYRLKMQKILREAI